MQHDTIQSLNSELNCHCKAKSIGIDPKANNDALMSKPSPPSQLDQLPVGTPLRIMVLLLDLVLHSVLAGRNASANGSVGV